MRKLKKQNAITLVALVITIVILLILAGISISALTNTGIFAKAKDAKKKFEDVELEQNTELDSYEWDTAITFIQKCSDETNYANQNSLNSGSLPEQTGTTKDNPCNIFDIASNVCEWVTETSNISGYPCVRRGGSYYNKDNYTCFRYSYDTPYNFVSLGFRPILYINNN